MNEKGFIGVILDEEILVILTVLYCPKCEEETGHMQLQNNEYMYVCSKCGQVSDYSGIEN